MAIGSALDALDDALEGEDYTLDTVMESQLHAQASSTPNTAVPSSISEEFSGTSYLETDIDEVLGLGAQDVEDNGPKVEPSSGSSGGDPTITSSPITRVSAAAPATTVSTTPLMHTVSFYRRTQQQQTPSAASTSKIGARKHLLIQEEEEPDDEAEQERVNEEIHELETQASAQTRAIAQASKALNVCNSSMEFSDSTERVECERVLLLSTNRRSALLNHVQSLRTEAVLGRTAYFSTATLSIGRIRIQAPRCGSHNSQMMRMHHYVLLARCGQYVEASEVLQRDQEDSSEVLEFKGLRLQGLNKDFRVILELYGMETRREYLSHDAKYKILKKIKNPLTPSKKQHLPLQSPAGPNAILSTSFALQASLTIVIGDLNKKQFQMTTSNSSGWGLTLDTELQANATCSVKHSGYLALFEDVNGLGCWVRRWAQLGNGWMQFWMYEGDAEDEKKPPITTIPLASITTSTVRPPPPSVCARANSILMESVRERRSSDKPSLTTELSGSITRVKWLLAADSKEERAEWLEMLNTVLEEHRRWQK
jgi:actin-binding protein anillin